MKYIATRFELMCFSRQVVSHVVLCISNLYSMDQMSFLKRSVDFGDSWACPLVFFRAAGGSALWALEYLHKALARVGCDKQRRHWLLHFKRKVEEHLKPFNAEEGQHVLLIDHGNLSSSAVEIQCQNNCCSTLALVTFVLHAGHFYRALPP